MKTFLIALSALLALEVSAQNFSSPNGHISAALEGDTALTVSYDGSRLFSLPQLDINGSGRWHLVGSTAAQHVEYPMITGKRSLCANDFNEYTLADSEMAPESQAPSLVLRLYNDGVAFRYIAPDSVKEENTHISIPRDSKRWMQKFDPSYEGFFPLSTAQDQAYDSWGYPALVQFDGDVFALFSEADIERGQAASWLSRSGKDYKVEWGSAMESTSTPWRMAIVGPLSAVVESTLVTDLASPSTIADPEWIEPGVASWVYWAYNHGSNDYWIVKKYIDMAAKLKMPYVLIDAEWDEMANGGTMEDAVAYAVARGIKPLIWYNSTTGWIDGAPTPKYMLNDPAKREREFERIAKLGVKGVKIDFFDGDKRGIMDYCIDLLESAARHGLTVNFHGATVPRGWQRTYPNLMSVEGVRGAEWYNNNHEFTYFAHGHNATLPFTRNVIGPMDYTPCAFSDSQYPHKTTNAHELALTVLYESGIQHIADRPESLMAQPKPVRDFFGTLPTAWDETLLLSGYPAHHAVIARRKGSDWYVAGINGTASSITLPIDLSRLGLTGDEKLQLFADRADDKKEWDITNPASVPTELRLHSRGGFLMKISR